MAPRTIFLNDAIYRYILSVSLREPEPLRQLRQETEVLPAGDMQIAPDQGQFMALMVELMGARKALEVGTFTGYSAICVALALPPDGRLVACDISREWTDIARRYWRRMGVEEKIDLRLGPALATLDALIAEGAGGTFDFIFLDADKSNTDAYYEAALKLARSGGLIVIDNPLRGGQVADPSARDPDTCVMRAVNEKIHCDPRVSCSLVPIGDGLVLARKR